MRIRKRMPTRAASPEERPEEKKQLAAMAGAQEAQIPAASKNSVVDAPKPEQPQGAGAAAKAEDARAARCSRNDGKRWRCKNAAAAGNAFCDSHIAWSTRKQKVKRRREDSKDLAKKEEDEEEAAQTNLSCHSSNDGFYYYGGYQPASRKRAKRRGESAEEEEVVDGHGAAMDSGNGVA